MLGQYLKKYRLDRNLTQIQMCELIGTSQYYYSKIENGLMTPGFTMIKKIAKALNLEESFIRGLL